MADDGFEISDLAGLKEPIKEAILAIRLATGIVYKPIDTRRQAKAEADALLIKTQAEIERSELLSKAATRLAAQEARRQSNIDSIVEMGLESLPEQLPKGKVEGDWLARFFQDCKDTSDESMQKAWARILAGEFEKPGSFSKRTLDLVKNLSQEEAKEIERAASRVWEVEEDGKRIKFINIIIDDKWMLGKEREEDRLFYIDYRRESQLLQDIGFLHAEDFGFHFGGEGRMEPELLQLSSSSARSISFYGREIIALPNQPGFVRTKGPTVGRDGNLVMNKWVRNLEFDAWRLSREGEELLKIIDVDPDLEQYGAILAALNKCEFNFELKESVVGSDPTS